MINCENSLKQVFNGTPNSVSDSSGRLHFKPLFDDLNVPGKITETGISLHIKTTYEILKMTLEIDSFK